MDVVDSVVVGTNFPSKVCLNLPKRIGSDQNIGHVDQFIQFTSTRVMNNGNNFPVQTLRINKQRIGMCFPVSMVVGTHLLSLLSECGSRFDILTITWNLMEILGTKSK